MFSLSPTTCLDHVKNDWPRNGVLRVEVLRNGEDNYDIEQSYAKEEKLRHERIDESASVLGSLLSPRDR